GPALRAEPTARVRAERLHGELELQLLLDQMVERDDEIGVPDDIQVGGRELQIVLVRTLVLGREDPGDRRPLLERNLAQASRAGDGAGHTDLALEHEAGVRLLEPPVEADGIEREQLGAPQPRAWHLEEMRKIDRLLESLFQI